MNFTQYILNIPEREIVCSAYGIFFQDLQIAVKNKTRSHRFDWQFKHSYQQARSRFRLRMSTMRSESGKTFLRMEKQIYSDLQYARRLDAKSKL